MSSTSRPAMPILGNMFDMLRRHIRNWIRMTFARGDLTALITTCALVIIPVFALSNTLSFANSIAVQSGPLATWRVDFSMMIPAALLSVLFGFLLARSHYSELTALVLSTIYALGSVLAIQVLSAPGTLPARFQAVMLRLASTIRTINDAETIGIDPFLLIMFLSLLIWFLGHNTAWHTFRLDRVWRAIIPPGLVLIITASSSGITGVNQRLDGYLVAYLFLSLLLLVRSHVEALEFEWYSNRIAFSGALRNWFFRIGALLSTLILVAAFLLPTGNAQENQQRFQQFMSQDSIDKIMEVLNKLFASVEGQGTATADYYGGEKLTLGNSVQLGEQNVMLVSAPTGPRYYWKSRVFDTYLNGEWTGIRANVIQNDSNTGIIIPYPPTDPAMRQDVEQTYRIVLKATNLLYAAPQPVTIRHAVLISADGIPGGAGELDPVSIRPLQPLRQGDTYTVVSSVTTATAPQLRAQGGDYPQWVTTKNLQIPAGLDPRIRELAIQITQGADTNYDRAKRIEQWLRTNITYDESPRRAPDGSELVAWTLFTTREGYCTHYASAMIMMLRTLGIPARMGAGFAQGVYTPGLNAYTVRERDAHTWVEVWFPNAGWVEFEPTSAQESVDRPDSQTQDQSPTPVPSPTESPTPTPSPTLIPSTTSSSPDPLVQPPTPTPPENPPIESPTPTSTTTPSPTPTPPAPIETPPPPSMLRFLEPPPGIGSFFTTLLLAALVIGGIMIGLGTLLWSVEYRGLDPLSPVGRAYARLGIYARWLKLPLTQANTPLERGRKLAKEMPEVSTPIIRITDSYIAERYAPPRISEAGSETPGNRRTAQAATEHWIDVRNRLWRRLLGR